ncbi:hypothetical protein FACS1894166_11360 [Bacilli bacterium]|nr:hypothetical protein FACS1894166_11360 [Bacilli bacterium]
MYSQGMSILQISQELKLVPNRIKYYLKNYGIKTRSKLESQAFYKHAGVAIEVTKPQLEQ